LEYSYDIKNYENEVFSIQWVYKMYAKRNAAKYSGFHRIILTFWSHFCPIVSCTWPIFMDVRQSKTERSWTDWCMLRDICTVRRSYLPDSVTSLTLIIQMTLEFNIYIQNVVVIWSFTLTLTMKGFCEKLRPGNYNAIFISLYLGIIGTQVHWIIIKKTYY